MKGKTLKPKEWTPKQLERLPQEGYWLNIWNWKNGETMYD